MGIYSSPRTTGSDFSPAPLSPLQVDNKLGAPKKFIQPKRGPKIGRRSKKSSFDFERAKEGLGLPSSAPFQQVYSATVLQNSTATVTRVAADDVEVVPLKASPCKAVVKRKLKRITAKMERSKLNSLEAHNELKTERMIRSSQQTEISTLKRKRDELEKITGQEQRKQKKQFMEEQGRINRQHRLELKQHNDMLEQQRTEHHQDIRSKDKEIGKLKVKATRRSKLDDLISQLSNERDSLKGRVISAEEHCRQLAEQLKIEKYSSRLAIDKIMSNAESLMEKANSAMTSVRQKEKVISAREDEVEEREAKRQKVAEGEKCYAAHQLKSSVKEAVHHERRVSARQRSKGKFVTNSN